MGIEHVQLPSGGMRVIDDSRTGASAVLQDYYPGATNKTTTAIIGSIARTDTAAKTLGTLPRGAIPIFLRLYSVLNSDAATTAVISVGITGTTAKYLSAFDVKTAATGKGMVIPNATLLFGSVESSTADTTVVGLYAETGTASTTGGPWNVVLEYYLP